MKTQTEKILNILRVVAWITFVGTIIIFVIQVVCFILGFWSDDIQIKFSNFDINFTAMRKNNWWGYLGLFGFIIILGLVKIIQFQKIKDILTKVNLETPFKMEMAEAIEKIAFLIGLIFVIETFVDIYYRIAFKSLIVEKTNLEIEVSYLYLGGIIYVISQIFKRGVELQEENELTV